MEDLLPIINFYRQQPQGYYVARIDYGYNDTYEHATSLDVNKIFEVWLHNSIFDTLMTDFRNYLKDGEPEDDENSEYSIILEITALQAISGLAGPMIRMQQEKNGLISYTIVFDNNVSVEDNQTLANRVYQYAFANIKNISWVKLRGEEFYYQAFDTAEELNNIITKAKEEDKDD
tara:strand:+ start:372 stop:896 length:525 start_codon:yes stop_codon:yes gene_type:complete